jgi:uncharacterized protein (DUF4415 family)
MALVSKTLDQIRKEPPDIDREKITATTEADIARQMAEDDTPEWTDTEFARARRGRPRLDTPKAAISLRLDADVLSRLRATGPGWQTRVNDVLRAWLDRHAG